MTIFPPSGYGPDAPDGTDPKWTRWFAWYPVKAERWAWLKWVECRLTPDGPPPNDVQRMQYRLV
jgi:hypothetical protein